MRIPLFNQQRILGGAAVLAVLQFGASVAGLLRDRILAGTFPELGIVDVYIAAFRPSDLLFQMLIMAGFSVALVPFLARHKAAENKTEMQSLLNSVVSVAAITFGIVAVFMAIFLPWLAQFLVRFTGYSLQLYIEFARLALFTNFLFIFGNAYGQYLITVQRYWVYGLTPILYTLGTIAGTLWLTPIVGPFGPIYGTLLGAVVYVILRMLAVRAYAKEPVAEYGLFKRSRMRLVQFVRGHFSVKKRLWHPELPEMFKLMLPRMIALGALQAELLLFDTVASGLEAGSVTINAYARNFQSVIVGVIGIALAQATYSLLSQAAGKGEGQRYAIYLKKGVQMILLFSIPAAALLYAFAPVAAWLVHLMQVLPVFSTALLIYSFSIPFESLNHLLLRSFYSLKQTVIPAVFSVINGTIAIAAAWLLVGKYGVYSIALAFTLGQVVQLIGLAVTLKMIGRKLITDLR